MATMALLRTAVGQTLRAARTEQSRTLRDVAREARVSLGYLSEVERGQKEASSELLNAICEALDLTLSSVIANVSLELKSQESAKLSVVDAAQVRHPRRNSPPYRERNSRRHQKINFSIRSIKYLNDRNCRCFTSFSCNFIQSLP